MVLDETELKIGKVNLKGIWIAVFFSAATTIGGGIWAASEFYGRIVALEESADNSKDISNKMTEVTTNLRTILEQQKELMQLKDRVNEAEKGMQKAALQVEGFNEKVSGLGRLDREISDIWKALDAMSNPLTR